MISRNQDLIDRVRSKVSAGGDVDEAANLMEEYSIAIAAHNRGLMRLEEVTKCEKALWDFVGNGHSPKA